MVHGPGELAFLDLREAGEFGEGHPLFAIPLPYSQLETRIGDLVPRHDTPLVLIDGGDNVAARGATALASLGYNDVAVMAGGTPAWAATGYVLYKGVNVPSKALGELAEMVWHPQMLHPDVLATWQDEGKDFAFFDTRPPAEYSKMRVPGARCMPNGELAHRLAHVDPAAPVVLTCAGRTRGIIGAIGLRLSGHDGPVYALENGTQGWALAGRDLERGNTADPLPPLDAAGQRLSQRRAERMLASYGINRIDGARAAQLLAETRRTTYLFDLRSGCERQADPLPAAIPVLGGQLVQATDQWIGVRRGRIILACDGGLRAALAAFWLKQLHYEVFVVIIDAALRALPAPPHASQSPTRTGRVDGPTGLAAMRAGALLIDLRGSRAYRQAHVAGAVWAIRPRLAGLGQLNDRGVIVISDDRATADLAAVELAALGARRVDWVAGGHHALVAAGAGVIHANPRPADADAIDHLFFVHDRHDGNLDACRRYLAWETGLVAQLDADERAEFRLLTPK